MIRRKRSRATQRESPANDLLYGTHAVSAALANPARHCLNLWATSNAARRLSELLGTVRTDVEIVKPDALDRRLGAAAVHQGVLLEAAPLPAPALEDLPGDGVLVVLDQVTDPHNIGAILRSCGAFGAHGLVVTERHAPATTGVLAKAASGALEHVPLFRVGNLARALKTIAGAGYQIIGLTGDAADDIADIDLAAGSALVLGAEGTGLRRLTRENCDRLARLRTWGPVMSLNVSNAAAVALYICARNAAQRAAPRQ